MAGSNDSLNEVQKWFKISPVTIYGNYDCDVKGRVILSSSGEKFRIVSRWFSGNERSLRVMVGASNSWHDPLCMHNNFSSLIYKALKALKEVSVLHLQHRDSQALLRNIMSTNMGFSIRVFFHTYNENPS
ncbi:hypothetical protein HAX54_028644 [Datura stramonium]|uniref:Uncharacterized protein n=1 Tax=Datura stramonium TaxID=4076 RepID=A0ABS8V4S1_DATST|nr:hypothetical protein [Datura stramonium]